jgi:hypothetical protein
MYTCSVPWRASYPTEAEELNFVDLVLAWTIASELSQIDLGPNGWLYVHVILPAAQPAELPAAVAATAAPVVSASAAVLAAAASAAASKKSL